MSIESFKPHMTPDRVEKDEKGKEDIVVRVDSKHEDSVAWKKAKLEKRIQGILSEEGSTDEAETDLVDEYLSVIPSTQERVAVLHELMVGHVLQGHSDAFARGLVKELWKDKDVKTAFLDTSVAQWQEGIENRLAPMAQEVAGLSDSIKNTRVKLETARQNPASTVGTKKEEVAYINRLKNLEASKEAIFTLSATETVEENGKEITRKKYEHIEENTDVAAMLMYRQLQEYYNQNEKESFVWFPSKKDDFELAIKHIKSGKGPIAIGPPGTGKTSLFEGVARSMTGESMIRVSCHPGMSDELLYTLEIKDGRSYKKFEGTATEALTGFKDEFEKRADVSRGLLLCLDEANLLDGNKSKAAVNKILDEFRRVGKKFEGKPILEGAMVTATANAPLADEAMERRFARMPVDYLKMSEEQPELYEFFLVSLLKNGKHLPPVPKKLLTPAYQEMPVPSAQQNNPDNILKDGSVVIKRFELIEDRTKKAHGFLYRLAHAIRGIQDAYIHGSEFNEKHLAGTAFYGFTGDDGKLAIKSGTDGYNPHFKEGDPTSNMVKLNSGYAAITAGLLNTWFTEYDPAGGKDLAEHVREHLDLYVGQLPADEQEKVRAILNHFHIFDAEQVAKGSKNEILSSKDTGYLSPRVPRPHDTKKPKSTTKKEKERITKSTLPATIEEYKTMTVLVGEESVNIKVGTHTFATPLSDEFTIQSGSIFTIDGKNFVFQGVAQDKDTNNKERLAASLSSDEKELCTLFNPEEVEEGILNHEIAQLEQDIALTCPQDA